MLIYLIFCLPQAENPIRVIRWWFIWFPVDQRMVFDHQIWRIDRIFLFSACGKPIRVISVIRWWLYDTLLIIGCFFDHRIERIDRIFLFSACGKPHPCNQRNPMTIYPVVGVGNEYYTLLKKSSNPFEMFSSPNGLQCFVKLYTIVFLCLKFSSHSSLHSSATSVTSF